MQGNLRGSLSVCWLFDMIRWPSGSGSLIKQHALRGVAPARIRASGSRFPSPPPPACGLPPSPNPTQTLPLSSFFRHFFLILCYFSLAPSPVFESSLLLELSWRLGPRAAVNACPTAHCRVSAGRALSLVL